MVTFDPKDPDDIDDFSLDWSARLASGEALATVAWAVTSGTVAVGATNTDGSVTTARISGGAEDEIALVRCRVVTSTGRQLDETLRIKVKTR